MCVYTCFCSVNFRNITHGSPLPWLCRLDCVHLQLPEVIISNRTSSKLPSSFSQAGLFQWSQHICTAYTGRKKTTAYLQNEEKKSDLLRVLFLIVGGGSSAAGGRNLKLPSPCLGVTTVVMKSHGAMERLASPGLHCH